MLKTLRQPSATYVWSITIIVLTYCETILFQYNFGFFLGTAYRGQEKRVEKKSFANSRPKFLMFLEIYLSILFGVNAKMVVDLVVLLNSQQAIFPKGIPTD